MGVGALFGSEAELAGWGGRRLLWKATEREMEGEGAVSERNVLAPYEVNELKTVQTVQQVCNTCVKHCYY